MSLDEAIRKEEIVDDNDMITICPNSTQNILVISTPDETTATKIANIKVLTINGKRHEANAYVSASEQMARTSTRRVPKTGDQIVPDLRIEEPKQRARVHAQVPNMRRGAPHGRPNVQGKIQVTAHSEAEKVVDEKQSRKGTHIGRMKDDPSADRITIGVQYSWREKAKVARDPDTSRR
ncbi:hypothetical protein HPB49_010357 [Dermacentor silvarum]|uniref:Uncharacterized protein n=1 Tax=Dermacentor silvarum TaxID=543639 RepID=A0ACB8DCY8_DERSI|nr:hypothetical protein HPB49_010357 [Dermacentor silvarum]